MGRQLGVHTTALLSDMNQPLGRLIGNAVEVHEALAVLRGNGPEDVRELTLELGSLLLAAARSSETIEAARDELVTHLDSGGALEVFERMVAAQGGDLRTPLRVGPESLITARHSGTIQAINTEMLGYSVIELGGGRRVQTGHIDHAVGLEMLVRIGDEVTAGQPLVCIFAQRVAAARVDALVERAISIGDQPASPPSLITEQIGDVK